MFVVEWCKCCMVAVDLQNSCVIGTLLFGKRLGRVRDWVKIVTLLRSFAGLGLPPNRIFRRLICQISSDIRHCSRQCKCQKLPN